MYIYIRSPVALTFSMPAMHCVSCYAQTSAKTVLTSVAEVDPALDGLLKGWDVVQGGLS